MGLDCYIVHGNDRDKAFTSKDDERIKDIHLCGSMFTSGHGSDGSFRVYKRRRKIWQKKNKHR